MPRTCIDVTPRYPLPSSTPKPDQTLEIPHQHEQIACTPCKHYSARTPFDALKTLWCSWCLFADDGTSFFFAGDTALCPAFAEIGNK